jgi:glycosyltransferase involved in cell wall biosynthesis/2-polyprenyl-3-methyl-5-hydroxy-6-metoxy-1,4-benzoquinol methylase
MRLHPSTPETRTILPTFADVHESGRRLLFHFYLRSVPFTRDVVEGRSSLGGSESACIETMQGLVERGHMVHAFADHLDSSLHMTTDHRGIVWRDGQELKEVVQYAYPDVFVSLRMPDVFALRIPAALRLLWNQDMLVDPNWVRSMAPMIDQMVYVSEYQFEQYRDLDPKVSGAMSSWVTPNAINYDLAHSIRQRCPKYAGRSTAPQFIHISRPERGVDALMKLWPSIRLKWPEAKLRMCRYSSMYDAGGWGQVCAAYDAKVEAVNAAVGGIEWLGELDKSQLYQQIAMSHIMLYPTSQPGFAETNCIAATESQACGTTFIGSWRGALAETVDPEAGILIDSEWTSDSFINDWLVAIEQVINADKAEYDAMRHAGIRKARNADRAFVAEEWERQCYRALEDRLHQYPVQVMRQLDQQDDVVTARKLAQIIQTGDEAVTLELDSMVHRADRIILQDEQTADDYAARAIQDPMAEALSNNRLKAVVQTLKEQLSDNPSPVVYDVACGNGAMTLLMLREIPNCRVYAFDFSQTLLDISRQACIEHGFLKVDKDGMNEPGSRVHHIQASIDPSACDNLKRDIELMDYPPADAVFCGEFIEHIQTPEDLGALLSWMAKPNGLVIITTPCGPIGEVMHGDPTQKRGHMLDFNQHDVVHVFGDQKDFSWEYLGAGETPRGNRVGFWIIGFRSTNSRVTRDASFEYGTQFRPLDHYRKMLTTRPYQRIGVGMIVRDAEEWLVRCLNTVRPIADVLVIHDTGSFDSTISLAKEYGGKYAVVSQHDWPEDFSVARNRTLAECEAWGVDWFLWIDADEKLEGVNHVRWFTSHSTPYAAYAIDQRHLQMDQPDFKDIPARIFKTGRGVNFHGVVHEQPEESPDKGINPCMHLSAVYVVHLGYQDRRTRTHKMEVRNLPLLRKEVNSPNPREISFAFAIRDHAQLSAAEWDDKTGKVSKNAVRLAAAAVKLYHDKSFDDPEHRLYDIVHPWYQSCLGLLRDAGVAGIVEVGWGFAATNGRLEGLPKPRLQLFRDRSTAERTINKQVSKWLAQLKPVELRVKPADGQYHRWFPPTGAKHESEPATTAATTTK